MKDIILIIDVLSAVVLIIGAMVVGPEFGPLSGLSVGLIQRRRLGLRRVGAGRRGCGRGHGRHTRR